MAGDGSRTRGVVAAKFRVPDVASYGRRRVHDALRFALRRPLVLVSAPAGAGKTTAVSSFVRLEQIDHAWYRAGAAESEADALLGHLEHALRSVVPELASGWRDASEGVLALSEVPDRAATVLVVDDVHELQGSPGEQVLGALVDEAPSWLHVVAMGREPAIGLDLARRRVDGTVAEVGPDVLRWRPWEVADLFREFYGEPLRPEDAARLTHRTGGWSAGLQLFHHATRQLPLASRTSLIGDLHTRPGLVRDYLTRHVLSRLPPELRTFLVDTCVLGRLEPSVCDALRDREDSAAFLTELTARQLFILPQEDGRGYRYHEVLRAHLHLTLVERDGAAEARSRHHLAGRLLEDADAIREAVQAYARAEAWDDVRRVLGTGGPVLVSGMTLVALKELPDGLVTTDPWLQLARARALVGDGRLAASLTAYAAAEDAFGSARLARLPRDERRLVRAWTGAPRGPAHHPLEHLRDATVADPATVVARLDPVEDPAALLAAGGAALLAGDPATSRRLARAVGARVGVEVVQLTLARVLHQLAAALDGGSVNLEELDAAANTLEQLGLVAIARVVRAVAGAARGTPIPTLLSLAAGSRGRDDPWGAAVVELTASLAGRLRGDDDPEPAARAVASLEALGAPVAVAWAALASPTAQPGGPDRAAAIERAESVGAAGLIDLVTALGSGTPPAAAGDRWRVHLHGDLRITVGERPLPLDELRPKAREGLALLLLEADQPLHEDQLMTALWPGTGHDTARHRLQVLLSSLRGLIDAHGGRREMLARRGRAYVLELPAGSSTDVRRAREALEEAAAAGRRGDDVAEAAALAEALEVTGLPLLPELSPVDWLSDRRERGRLATALAARRLAELQLAAGTVAAAIRSCHRSLGADRYSSASWELLVSAHEEQADHAAAAHARAGHREVLVELGVEVDLPT